MLNCDRMKLLAYITDTFIDIFGITHPRPEQRRMANLLIGGVILGFFTLLLIAAAILFYQSRIGGTR
jgi:hypothetical protein